MLSFPILQQKEPLRVCCVWDLLGGMDYFGENLETARFSDIERKRTTLSLLLGGMDGIDQTTCRRKSTHRQMRSQK